MYKLLTIIILILGITAFQLVSAGGPLVGDDWEEQVNYEPVGASVSQKMKRGGSNDEFHEYLRMANYELKMLGGRFTVNKGESVLEALNRNILEREVRRTEKPSFRKRRIRRRTSYKEYRRDLINKARFNRIK